MTRIATAKWIWIAGTAIALCGCTSGSGWWGKKKDDSLAASRPPALPYSPNSPALPSSGQTPGGGYGPSSIGSTQSGGTTVASATSPATGTYNSATPAAYTPPASSSYPSTGYGAPNRGTPSYPATGYGASATPATGYAPPAASSGAPWSANNTPAGASAAAGSVATQNGMYNPAYGGNSGNSVAAAPSYPATATPAAITVPEKTAASGDPFGARNSASGGDIRTADSRWSRPAGDTAAASGWTAAPATSATPWGTNAATQTDAGAARTAFNDPNLGASSAGSNDKSAGTPRKDPYYRPGSTKDFNQNSPMAAPVAPASNQTTGRTDTVVPANYSANDANQPSAGNGAAANSTPWAPAPWGGAPSDVSAPQPSAADASRYLAPANSGNVNSNVRMDGSVDMSASSGNLIRR